MRMALIQMSTDLTAASHLCLCIQPDGRTVLAQGHEGGLALHENGAGTEGYFKSSDTVVIFGERPFQSSCTVEPETAAAAFPMDLPPRNPAPHPPVQPRATHQLGHCLRECRRLRGQSLHGQEGCRLTTTNTRFPQSQCLLESSSCSTATCPVSCFPRRDRLTWLILKNMSAERPRGMSSVSACWSFEQRQGPQGKGASSRGSRQRAQRPREPSSSGVETDVRSLPTSRPRLEDGSQGPRRNKISSWL